jgi:hypothetical protein
MIKIGSIVRVVKQPPSLHVQIQNEVAVVKEILEDWASIETLRLDGIGGGCGSVPLSALELETNPMWIEIKSKREREVEKYQTEILAYSARYNMVIKELAIKHNISYDSLVAISNDLAKLELGF